MSSEQMVYDAVRQGIYSGRYLGGHHLRTDELARSLGVSRTPVREALRRLHAEGLVEMHANRGAFVSSFSTQDIDEVFELRIMLESHAAALAARHLDVADITRLTAFTDEMERCAELGERNAERLAAANDGFHAVIVAATSNRRLGAMIASVVELSWVARTFGIYAEADLAASIFHHRELIKAFEARDPAWAAAVMSGHIKAAFHVFKASIATRPQSGL